MAAVHQQDPATQCLGLPPPGAEGVAGPVRSLRLRFTQQTHGAGLLEGNNPNLRTGVIHRGRLPKESIIRSARMRSVPLPRSVFLPVLDEAETELICSDQP